MTTAKNGRASFSSSSGALLAVPYSLTHGETRNFDLTTSSPNDTTYTVADPAYVSSQLKSSEWLQRYGLKSQKLTFDQILQQIGFKRVESFNTSVGKTVGAKYAGNLYHEIQHDNGDRYVLTCRPEKLREYRHRLGRMLTLLQKRLAFITSGSRRVFGIVGEPSICIVCDCKTSDHRIFNQFQLAVTSLFKEQVTKIKRFNIIWVSNDNEQFQGQPIDVTSTTIDQAIDWISNQKCTQKKISISATCEAILKAFNNTVHGIYLISEGNSSDSAREMLRDNIVKTRLSSKAPIPIHVISLFCQNNDTETFLRSISQTANGSYFSYKIKNEITDFKIPSNLMDPTRIKLQDNKLQFGTNVSMPNSEHPTDASLMYKEINQCQNTIDRLDKILGFVRDENENPVQAIDTTKSLDVANMSNKLTKNGNNLQRSLIIQSSALFHNDENDMASIDWLKIYGVVPQKLDFFSVLQSAAFRHCDGIVTLFKPPNDTNGKKDDTPANPKAKLINAKYCDQFAHVTWPDGTIRHVYVTPELHRDYERQMRALLGKINARLSWLKKGSRDVFGTILEKNIYILIDTSKSMQNHLNFVKDKLRLLVKDQLFSKERINMVSFNTIVNPWRDRLTKVNDSTTQSQLQQWIDGLNAEGSTNTLAAIRLALADPVTEAIYLLTDGRPDQNERHILSQIQYRQITPIHTIAFNCQDQTANQFLFDLAKQTGGRFHAFNYGVENQSSIEIPESEDISYLKQELIRGEKDLQRVADLRDECMGRTWSRDNAQTKYQSSQLNELPPPLSFRSRSALDITRRPSSSTMPQQTDRKKRSSISLNRKHKSKSVTQSLEQTNTLNLNPNQWLLPETEEYLRTNSRKQNSTSPIESEEEQEQVVSTKRISTPYDEVKFYLKKNSLVSKGLTIFDVLYPVSITVKEPHHVEVIDRYVLAKVWDDILPLTYGSYANKFRLVNHYAVDLEKYETKLKNLLTDYYQFTAKFMWKSLSDEDKQKVGPHIYWINLSTEEKNRNAQEITKEEHINKKELEPFVWEKLSVDERSNLLQKPAIYNDQTQVILKNTLKDAKAESALQGVTLMDVEIKRAIKFLQISNDLRQHQKRVHNEGKPGKEPIIKPPPSTNWKIGQRVLSRYDGDGYFYPGTIQKNQDGLSIVLFDMDVEQKTIAHALLPLNNSNYQLILFLQDCVLVRQLRQTEEYWTPGLVFSLPSPFALPPNLYKIQIYDPHPKQIYAHRKDMIRITLGLFQRSVLYLQNINRRSATNGYVDPPRPSSTPPIDFEAIFRKLLDPLTEKVEHMRKSHQERFNQLQRALEDLMNAIRILQERPHKPQSKDESDQTDPIPTSRRTPTPPLSGTPPKQILKRGTPVYAVWFDDDALVYEGKIVESIGSNEYTVERADFPNVKSEISRNDIFLHSNHCLLKYMDTESFALVKYPNDSRHCFCPAVILRHRHHHHQPTTEVRFYDCHVENIVNDQCVIPINEQQFERYTEYRIEKEKSLINQVVVGLNNKKPKSFMLGTIKNRVRNGHEYFIEWYDDSKNEQKEEHLFGAFTRRNQHTVGAYVLAMDNNDNIYKPARIISISNDRKSLKVQFINLNGNSERSSPRTTDVPATTTFVITEAYLDTISKLLYT